MKKQFKILLLSILSIILIMTAVFLIYVSDYYKADNSARAVMERDDKVSVNGTMTILSPEGESDTALIFYPGAKVEHIAYLPILDKLRKYGITCVLIDMPFNMAIFNQNAAAKVFKVLPKIKNWYIGGHSMGGAMASSYAANNPDKIKGLILLGAYVYGDFSPQDALTIYGTFNANLEKFINYKENIVIIEGGNHAQFGNYGDQKGDPDATISREKQQDIAVAAIVDFIQEKNK